MMTPSESTRLEMMSRLLRRLRRLSAHQGGSIGIIAAVTLPALLGFGGLAVDASLWLRAKNSVQGAADAAASSSAAAAAAGGTSSRILAETQGVAAVNGYQNAAACPISWSSPPSVVAVCLNNPPTVPGGAHIGNTDAYEVIVTAPQQLYLARALP